MMAILGQEEIRSCPNTIGTMTAVQFDWLHPPEVICYAQKVHYVANKRYQAVGFPCNRMLKLSSSRVISIDVPVLSVLWSFEDHSVIIQALRNVLIEHEASDTGGIPRWKSSCPDRLAEATISR